MPVGVRLAAVLLFLYAAAAQPLLPPRPPQPPDLPGPPNLQAGPFVPAASGPALPQPGLGGSLSSVHPLANAYLVYPAGASHYGWQLSTA